MRFAGHGDQAGVQINIVVEFVGATNAKNGLARAQPLAMDRSRRRIGAHQHEVGLLDRLLCGTGRNNVYF